MGWNAQATATLAGEINSIGLDMWRLRQRCEAVLAKVAANGLEVDGALADVEGGLTKEDMSDGIGLMRDVLLFASGAAVPAGDRRTALFRLLKNNGF